MATITALWQDPYVVIEGDSGHTATLRQAQDWDATLKPIFVKKGSADFEIEGNDELSESLRGLTYLALALRDDVGLVLMEAGHSADDLVYQVVEPEHSDDAIADLLDDDPPEEESEEDRLSRAERMKAAKREFRKKRMEAKKKRTSEDASSSADDSLSKFFRRQ